MKQCGRIFVGVALLGLWAAAAPAQVFHPIDPTKRADNVNGKDLQFGIVESKTVTLDTREMNGASVSDKIVELKGDMKLTKLKLKSLDLATVTKADIPHKNFTTKRAAIADDVQLNKDLSDVREAKAPISQRQIHPFAPGGEEELKKQLGEPSLSVH